MATSQDERLNALKQKYQQVFTAIDQQEVIPGANPRLRRFHEKLTFRTDPDS